MPALSCAEAERLQKKIKNCRNAVETGYIAQRKGKGLYENRGEVQLLMRSPAPESFIASGNIKDAMDKRCMGTCSGRTCRQGIQVSFSTDSYFIYRGKRQRWRVGTDCKSVAYRLAGSNPAFPTSFDAKSIASKRMEM
jgi:hypothetical protein